jgi:uncharacterized membrane protein
MSDFSSLTALLIVWAAVTTALVILIIYRSLVGMKEDDQLFLDPAEANLEAEQKAVLAKLEQLAPYTKILSVASGVLLLAIMGVWIYRAIQSPGY